MSFHLVPDEIVTKIMGYLADDAKGFIGLASSCRRYHHLLDSFVRTSHWIEKRPLTFNFYLDPRVYLEFQQQQVSELPLEGQLIECDCIKFKESRRADAHLYDVIGRRYRADKPTRRSECYKERIACWLQSKRRRFSTLKFMNSNVYNANCISDSFRQTLTNSSARQLAEINIQYLVSLEIFNCCTTVGWLDELLAKLPNVSHLKLTAISYRIPNVDHDDGSMEVPKFSRPLERLQMSDSIPVRVFNYLLNGYPAKELDLSNLLIKSHSDHFYWQDHIPRTTIRLDHYAEPTIHVTSSISVLAVMPYLLKQQKSVKHLIAELGPEAVLKIIQHDQLGHLRLTVLRSTDDPWSQLIYQLSKSELDRVRMLQI